LAASLESCWRLVLGGYLTATLNLGEQAAPVAGDHGGGRPGAGEQFLSYDGAEVGSWSLFVVELSDERKGCPALDEIDKKIRIDQMLSH